MKSKYFGVATLLLTSLAVSASTNGAAKNLAQASQGQPGSFGDLAFQRIWDRTDQLVASGKVKRSFYWGPQPNTGALQEDYAEGVGGKRLVQYFDKSRMEINNPAGDKSSPFYVTNGLLTVEMMEGKVQIANNGYRKSYPANLPLASDHNDPDAPTYASFLKAVRNEADETGMVVKRAITKDGPRDVTGYEKYNVKNAHYVPETFHNIPDVFWSFLNASGPVMEGGKQVAGKLNSPWFYAAGYPITEAFWATVKIEDRPGTDVLIQPFQRRVLTYVPSAPEGFRVQMGNIGQHYYDWRYKDAGKPLASSLECDTARRGTWTGVQAKLWEAKADVRAQAGCFSFRYYEHIVLVYQRFQGGAMLYQIGGSNDSYLRVLYSDGTAASLLSKVEDFEDLLPTPPAAPTAITPIPTAAPLPPTPVSLVPPPGLYAPMPAFTRIWRSDEAMRKQLGWAIDPGTVLRPTLNREAQKDVVQVGDYANMYDLGPQLGKVLVLYEWKESVRSYGRNWVEYDRP